VRDGGFLKLYLRLEREFAVVVAMKGSVRKAGGFGVMGHVT
jgi:hypothetical protein